MDEFLIISGRGSMKNTAHKKCKELEKKLNKIAPELYMRIYSDFILHGEIDEEKILADFLKEKK